jgi:hypothetical protein
MKIRSVGAEFFFSRGRTDGHRDRHDKANRRLSHFCERALKMGLPKVYAYSRNTLLTEKKQE